GGDPASDGPEARDDPPRLPRLRQRARARGDERGRQRERQREWSRSGQTRGVPRPRVEREGLRARGGRRPAAGAGARAGDLDDARGRKARGWKTRGRADEPDRGREREAEALRGG